MPDAAAHINKFVQGVVASQIAAVNDRVILNGMISASMMEPMLNPQGHNNRIKDGARIFSFLSWIGGVFGVGAFTFSLYAGATVAPGFYLLLSLVSAYLLFPTILKLTNRLDLMAFVALLWAILCVGAASWYYGGYAVAALQWLCVIPLFAYYYLSRFRRMLILAAMGTCFLLISVRQFSGQSVSTVQMDGTADILYGTSFALLLLYLSMASGLFRSAENRALEKSEASLSEARRERQEARLERQKAIQANDAKSQLLASVSHELRTPLNAIIGFSDLLRQRNMSAAYAAKLPEYADDIYFSANHLLALINDILDYAQGESENATIQETSIDLNEAAETVLKLIAFQPKAGGLIIEQRFDSNLPSLVGDERRIKQIMINLLVNAIKFTPKGGRVGISIKRNESGGVDIIVTDSGIGIPKDEVLKVTQPFFKASNSDSFATEGVGMGLAVTAEIVRLHDGTLSIVSEPGSGTTVTCSFPAKRTNVALVADSP